MCRRNGTGYEKFSAISTLGRREVGIYRGLLKREGVSGDDLVRM